MIRSINYENGVNCENLKCEHVYYHGNEDQYYCLVDYCRNEPNKKCIYCLCCEYFKQCIEEYEYFIDCQREENI